MLKLKAGGLRSTTLGNISAILKHLAKHVNLDKPEDVKTYIANKNCAESFKANMVKAYDYYAVVNGISWIKPKYNPLSRSFKVPTTEAVYKIIAGSGPKYSMIFRLLAETGAGPEELHQVRLRDIDLEKAVINIPGCKGHNARTIPLKPSMTEALRTYLSKYGLPFPYSLRMCRKWRMYRNRVAEKLNDPSLRQIRAYDLRHYFCSMTYHKTKDPLYTMRMAGHKKLQTTLIYTQIIEGEEEWTSAVAMTVEEACSLVEAGFEYVTEVEGVKIFRKRK